MDQDNSWGTDQCTKNYESTTISQYKGGLVYDVMTQIDPEGLESQGKVGQKKRQGDDWYIYITGKITV